MNIQDEQCRPLRIKVIRVISRIITGGPTRQVRLLAQDMSDLGYATTVAIGTPEKDERGVMDTFIQAGIETVTIPGFQRRITPLQDLRALIHLWRLFKKERPHVVHTHTSKAGALGRVAARLAGVPVVVHTFHGHVFQGYFSRPVAAFAVYFERMFTRITDRVLTISRQLEREIAEDYRVASGEKLSCVALGLDLDACARHASGRLHKELGLPPDTPIVGTAGRLTLIKNHKLLLDVFAHLSLDRAHLVIAGDGSLRNVLQEEAARLGIAGRVHFLGWRDDLPDLYPDMSLFVLTSYNEGTPVAAIEAIACGVPVLATNVGGMADMIIEGVTGRLVLLDRTRIIAAMQEMLTDRMIVPEDESEKIKERFAISRLVRDLDALYRELLEKKGVST